MTALRVWCCFNEHGWLHPILSGERALAPEPTTQDPIGNLELRQIRLAPISLPIKREWSGRALEPQLMFSVLSPAFICTITWSELLPRKRALNIFTTEAGRGWGAPITVSDLGCNDIARTSFTG